MGASQSHGPGLAETSTLKPQPCPHRTSPALSVRLWESPAGEGRPSLGKVGEHCPVHRACGRGALPPQRGRGCVLRGRPTERPHCRGGRPGPLLGRVRGPERTLGLGARPLLPPCGSAGFSPLPYEPRSGPRARAPPGLHVRGPQTGRLRPGVRGGGRALAGARGGGSGAQAPKPQASPPQGPAGVPSGFHLEALDTPGPVRAGCRVLATLGGEMARDLQCHGHDPD